MTWTGSGHVFLKYINEHLLIGAEQIMEKFRVIPSDSIFGCSHFALLTAAGFLFGGASGKASCFCKDLYSLMNKSPGYFSWKCFPVFMQFASSAQRVEIHRRGASARNSTCIEHRSQIEVCFYSLHKAIVNNDNFC